MTRKMTQSETTQFRIGSKVSCSDGVCGKLSRVVMDPVTRALTHLVVESRLRLTGHLVPIALVDSQDDEVRLRSTRAQFAALDEADLTQFVTGAREQPGYGQNDASSTVCYQLVVGDMSSVGIEVGIGMGMGVQSTTFDRVPLGKVEVRRGDCVQATDGAIGRVQGLVIDPRDHHVTHVLLDDGHLWGEKEVSIPIRAVVRLDDGIQLNLSKEEVWALPPVDFDRRSESSA